MNLTCFKEDERPALVLLLKKENIYNLVQLIYIPKPLKIKQLEEDLLKLLFVKNNKFNQKST